MLFKVNLQMEDRFSDDKVAGLIFDVVDGMIAVGLTVVFGGVVDVGLPVVVVEEVFSTCSIFVKLFTRVVISTLSIGFLKILLFCVSIFSMYLIDRLSIQIFRNKSTLFSSKVLSKEYADNNGKSV